MQTVNEKNRCCGCGLCAVKCPKDAIEMKEDEYGYIYPFINEEKCIKCGICKKVCPFINETESQKPIETYASILKDQEALEKSASGGVFIGIASRIIEDGGVVFGCAMDYSSEEERLIVHHIKVSSKDELYKLQGSKYVQSNAKDIYPLVLEELTLGKTVLFSGTPCQVAALKHSLGKDYKNLYTIDIICHGVPSNKMFNDYIKLLEEEYKSKVKEFRFRDKSKGWGLNFAIVLEDGRKKHGQSFKSSYYQLFLDSLIYRDSCYNCPYACDKRVGDITIGDFWGVEKEYESDLKTLNIDTQKGVSCILVNNNQGHELVKKYCDEFINIDSHVDIVKKYNHQLVSPSESSEIRGKILDLYKDGGYKKVDEYYKKSNFIKNKIKVIWYAMPNGIKKIIKK